MIVVAVNREEMQRWIRSDMRVWLIATLVVLIACPLATVVVLRERDSA